MTSPVMLLFAQILPATFLFYLVGGIVLRKCRVSQMPVIAGFAAAWILTAVFALLLADEPTVESASEVVVPAAIASVVIVVSGIAARAKRRPDGSVDAESKDRGRGNSDVVRRLVGNPLNAGASSIRSGRVTYLAFSLILVALVAHLSFFSWTVGWTHYSMYNAEVRHQKPRKENPQLLIQLGESSFSTDPKYKGYKRGVGVFFRDFVRSQTSKVAAIFVGILGSLSAAIVGVYLMIFGRVNA